MSSSAEGELSIDEPAVTISLAPNLCVVPHLSVAVQEGEKSVREFLDHLSGEESFANHIVLGGANDDKDSFVVTMSGITAVVDAESLGWTFADALAFANLSVETLVENLVDTSHFPTC